MHPVLSLYEDILSNGATLALPAHPRMIFVVHGIVTIAGKTLSDGETWHGEGAVTITAGVAGACCWRYELTDGDACRALARPGHRHPQEDFRHARDLAGRGTSHSRR